MNKHAHPSEIAPTTPVEQGRLSVSLFGPFALTAPGGADATPRGRKSKALFAMLALSPNGRRARAWLQDRLWSDKPADRGRTNLRQELSVLRKHLTGIGVDILSSEGDDVILNLSRLDIDALKGTMAAHHELLEGLDVGDPEFEYWLSEERAFRYNKTPAATAPAAAPAAPKVHVPHLIPRLSIQPFKAIGGGEAVRFTEGLDSELSSSFATFLSAYKLIDYQFLNQDDADLVIQGTVRVDDGITVVAQILQLPQGALEWSERLSLPHDASHRAQQNAAQRIVEAVQRLLSEGEVPGQAESATTTSTKAWELYQKGRALEMWCGPHRLAPSITYYRGAVTEDPGFVQAKVSLAFRLIDGVRNCWTKTPDRDLVEARALASELAEETSDQSLTKALLAFVNCAEGQFEEGRRIMQEVLEEAPTSPENASCLGTTYDYLGQNEQGAMLHRHALTLTRFPPVWIRTNLALSLLFIDPEEALQVADGVLAADADNARALMVKTVCLVRRGELDQARALGNMLKVLEPGITAARWRSPTFFAKPEQQEAVAADLAKAGL